MCVYQLNPTMSRISLILHESEAKLKLSVNIKDIPATNAGGV